MFKWLKQLRKKKQSEPQDPLAVIQSHENNRLLSDEDRKILEDRKREFEEAQKTKSGVSVVVEDE